MQAGASAKYKSILTLFSVNSDAVKGSHFDAMLAFGRDVTTTAQWNYGIAFGRDNGRWPIDFATGTIIGVPAGIPEGASALYGIDFSQVAFSGRALKMQGFEVDGSGNIANQLRLRDYSAPGPGAFHRIVGLGNGSWAYQVDTSPTGRFFDCEASILDRYFSLYAVQPARVLPSCCRASNGSRWYLCNL